jgi:uncharacterized membrane protein YeaQ/YmgE (transglycosylase-associated protein family)
MPMLLVIIVIGAAAGFLATRLMRVQTDVPTTIVIGIVGSVFGWAVLRFLIMITGWAAMFVGGVIGAVALIWLWRRYTSR